MNQLINIQIFNFQISIAELISRHAGPMARQRDRVGKNGGFGPECINTEVI